jgi:hypothetical protein
LPTFSISGFFLAGIDELARLGEQVGLKIKKLAWLPEQARLKDLAGCRAEVEA